MITPETDHKIKTWGDRFRALQSIGWIAGILVSLGAFYVQWIKKDTLRNAVTKEDLTAHRKENREETKAIMDSTFRDFEAKLKLRAEKFVDTYMVPMMDTDDELKAQMKHQSQTLQIIVNSSNTLSTETRSKLRAKAESDSLRTENERLKSKFRTQERAGEIIEEVNDDALRLKEKRRKRRERDQIE